VPDSERYDVEVVASPEWQPSAGDVRRLTVNLSMLRLIPLDPE